MKKAIIIFVFAIVFLSFFFMICVDIIPLDRVGVRSNMLGEGVQRGTLEPGMCVVIPGMHKLDILDATLQELSFATNKYQEALRLRTSDEYTIEVDVTIYYRINAKHAWAILTKMGSNYAFRDRFRQKARDAIWRIMSKMETEDFYNSDKRVNSAIETVKYLNQELAKEGHRDMEKDTKKVEPDDALMIVENLLIRKVVFDRRFEMQLIRKQLLQQREGLAVSQKLREDEQRKTELIERETAADVLRIQKEQDKDITILKAQTEAKIEQILADASYKEKEALSKAVSEQRQNIAEGEKLKEIAKAKGQKAINEAYQNLGGHLLLSRKFVENIEIGDIEINTNLTNPFDVEEFLRMVGTQLDSHQKKTENSVKEGAAEKR